MRPVASTIGLGHALGPRFVAEGVETRAALDQLTALGCDGIQGYYVSRAQPLEALTEWLRATPWAPWAADRPTPS